MAVFFQKNGSFVFFNCFKNIYLHAQVCIVLVCSMEKLLFVRIAAGDESAFKVFFDTHNKKIYTFTYQMTQSSNVSEEIVLDVFLKIWEQRHQLTTIDNPSNYIFILARNKCLDYMRQAITDQKRKALLYANSLQLDYQEAEAYQQLNLDAFQQVVDNAISHLPEQKQLIFHLSRHEGWTNEEIANHLHLSKSRVANAMVEVLKYIRNYIGSHTPELSFLVLYISCFLLQ